MKKIDPKLNPFRGGGEESIKKVLDVVYDDINSIISSINNTLNEFGSVNEMTSTSNKIIESIPEQEGSGKMSTSDIETGSIRVIKKIIDDKESFQLAVFVKDLGWCTLKDSSISNTSILTPIEK